MKLPDHVERNREQWGEWAAEYAIAGRAAWASTDPHWGTWAIPESELRVLGDTDRLRGLDVVELGCGTAYWSAWFARWGARPVGVDVTPGQLATARELQREHGLEFDLVEASAEQVPLPDASFDLAFSEYGASIWCNPMRWIPEAARLLRPGGELVFLANSFLSMLCTPPSGAKTTTSLERDWPVDSPRFEWGDDEDNSVEFHLPHGELIALLRSCGFTIEALHEPVPSHNPREAASKYLDWDWCRRWPCEEIWVARRA